MVSPKHVQKSYTKVFRYFTNLNICFRKCAPIFEKDIVSPKHEQKSCTKVFRCCTNFNKLRNVQIIGLPSLEYRRRKSDLVERKKINNDQEVMQSGP